MSGGRDLSSLFRRPVNFSHQYNNRNEAKRELRIDEYDVVHLDSSRCEVKYSFQVWDALKRGLQNVGKTGHPFETHILRKLVRVMVSISNSWPSSKSGLES